MLSQMSNCVAGRSLGILLTAIHALPHVIDVVPVFPYVRFLACADVVINGLRFN